MKLEAISATGFRSISNAGLESCGELNVLIGKNNSGKSNILTAIKFFFDFFNSEGEVATVTPDVRKATDWHGREMDSPVCITATLMLEDQELDTLKEAIATEAPQVRNGLFGSDRGNLVTIELRFVQSPMAMGYISCISFGDSISPNDGSIFAMQTESAADVARRIYSSKAAFSEINAVETLARRLDAEYWPRSLDRGVMPPMARNLIDQIGEHTTSLGRLVRGATTYSEFQRACQDRIQVLHSTIEETVGTAIEHPVTTFSGDSTEIPDYVSSFVRKVGALQVHHLSEQRKSIGQEEAARILKLKTSRGQGQVLRGLQSVVSGLLGVQIDAFSADDQAIRRGRGVTAELDVDEFLVQVNGSGIREALRLILDYEFERPDMMLVEEPEVHLHPALETALMQYLKNISKDCQVFLTTHSTNFLDVGSLRNVYMIRKSPDTQVQLLDVTEAEEAVPQELGIRLSSLFMFDRLIFVEGPSDEQILRTFADTLDVSFGQAALGFVTTGGARNFTHYATASTLSFLGKRNVKTVFILDRDERNEEDLEKLQRQVEGTSEVRVLRRREMENYLLSPGALARFIRNKSQGVSQPTETEIVEAINEACESLLEVAIERRVLKRVCSPLIPDRRAIIGRGEESFDVAVEGQLSKIETVLTDLQTNLPDMLATARTEVLGEWADRKLDIVPGEEIIGLVFAKFDVRFNKRQDGVKIASMMTHAEIPNEIAAIIRNLVK